jgi:hypothetical protein
MKFLISLIIILISLVVAGLIVPAFDAVLK